MITTRNTSILTKQIFRGKEFLLDANIIFRLSGINKDDRQYVASSFAKKCSEVGIRLSYSSETFDEVNRVITNQIKYIAHISGGSQPISPILIESISDSNGNSDFYRLYYDWCQEPQNKCNDFVSFQKYLFRLTNSIIADLNYVQTPNYANGDKASEYSVKFDSLLRFKKDKRTQKHISAETIKCDINNILHVLSLRKDNGQSIFQTNFFIVSADQALISWMKNEYTGIPVVVLPSVWLSIILRFAGRSDDDYKAFCMFLSLRRHINEDGITINPAKLLRCLSSRTVDREIKESIIQHIIDNSEEYAFNNDADYDNSVQKAFDKVIQEKDMKSKSDLEKAELLNNSKHLKEIEILNEKLLSLESEKENILVKEAKRRAHRKIEWIKEHPFLSDLIPIFIVLVMILLIIAYCVEFEPICSRIDILIAYIDNRKLMPAIMGLLTIITSLLLLIYTNWKKYLVSDEREKKLFLKFYNESRDVLRSE